MSVTVYVDGWDKQPSREVRVYQCEKYPNLTEEDFATSGYPTDEDGRHYRYERVYDDPYPSMYFSEGQWFRFSGFLNLSTVDGIGRVEREELRSLFGLCLRLLNSTRRQADASQPTTKVGRVVYGGSSMDDIARSTEEFIQLLKFSIDRQKSIYWA